VADESEGSLGGARWRQTLARERAFLGWLRVGLGLLAEAVAVRAFPGLVASWARGFAATA
jgi:uncharacterized membrane protein YidH (DUF202 family)